MIGYLKGEILENSEGRILIGVGDKERHGVVGYSVCVPTRSIYESHASGKMMNYLSTLMSERTCSIFTVLAVA
jgi:Holliday junction resolvasome RuvABC DNA-binding subunit